MNFRCESYKTKVIYLKKKKNFFLSFWKERNERRCLSVHATKRNRIGISLIKGIARDLRETTESISSGASAPSR